LHRKTSGSVASGTNPVDIQCGDGRGAALSRSSLLAAGSVAASTVSALMKADQEPAARIGSANPRNPGKRSGIAFINRIQCCLPNVHS